MNLFTRKRQRPHLNRPSRKNSWRRLAVLVARCAVPLALALLCTDAYAQVASSSWLSGLQAITCNVQQAARYFALAGIIMFGILVMKMELKGWIHDLMLMLFGISIIVFAASFLNGIFPSAGFSSIACA